MTTVLVLGASGAMGERVVRLLGRFAPGVRVKGANRSGRAHPHVHIVPADVRSWLTLTPILQNADLVVNAVGPYDYDPTPVVQASIEARAHYVDLAESPGFVAGALRAARARGAAQAGVAVVSGASTVPGLVALLAQRWAQDAEVARVCAWLSMGTRNPVSPGLLAGMLAPLGRRPGPEAGGERRRWFTRPLRLAADGRRLVFGSYPIALPPEGLRLGERHVPVRFHMGFDRAGATRALILAAPLLGRLPAGAVRGLAGPLGVAAPLLRALGTTRGVLAVVAEDAGGAERGRIEVRALEHGLDVPALPPVWIAARLHEGAGLGAGGPASLADVVSLERALAGLRAAGYEVAGDLPGASPA